jgi:hypothetical protein
MRYICEIFRHPRFSSFSTQSAKRRHRDYIRHHHGGAVLRIEGNSDTERIQAASCGRLTVISPKPRFAATSRATARVKCAIVGAPCISGSATHPSNSSAIRWARANSCAKTVGERRLGGEPSHVPIRRCLRTCCAPRTQAADKPNPSGVEGRGSEAYHLGCRDKRR